MHIFFKLLIAMFALAITWYLYDQYGSNSTTFYVSECARQTAIYKTCERINSVYEEDEKGLVTIVRPLSETCTEERRIFSKDAKVKHPEDSGRVHYGSDGFVWASVECEAWADYETISVRVQDGQLIVKERGGYIQEYKDCKIFDKRNFSCKYVLGGIVSEDTEQPLEFKFEARDSILTQESVGWENYVKPISRLEAWTGTYKAKE